MRSVAGDTWYLMAWIGAALITALGIISAVGGIPSMVPILAAVIWYPAITALYLLFRHTDRRATRRDR